MNHSMKDEFALFIHILTSEWIRFGLREFYICSISANEFSWTLMKLKYFLIEEEPKKLLLIATTAAWIPFEN